MSYFKKLLSVLIVLLCLAFLPSRATNAVLAASRPIIFPVIGEVWYANSFQDPRDGGTRWHKGIDIFGKKMMPLVAVVDGTVTLVPFPEASWGYGVRLTDKDGYEYWYIHMNNDTPGTDDGKAGGTQTYALDIMKGNPVKQGQLIGYMGDSGNAETTPAHLHFEMYAPEDNLMNPYESLVNAVKITKSLASYPEMPNEILPFDTFTAGGFTAVGKLDNVSTSSSAGSGNNKFIVAGAGPGGQPLVRAFLPDKTPLVSFYAYDKTFRGGVDVAAGDVNGDGKDEIITAAGSGGGPHIRVFGLNGKLISEFFAYDQKFRGGVNVSSADLDGDGKVEIVTAPASKGGPHVRVFDSLGKIQSEFMAYDAKFRGGVDVAGISTSVLSPTVERASLPAEALAKSEEGGQISGGGNIAGIVTAPGQGGGPHVKIFSALGLVQKEFMAYEGKFSLGLRISGGDILVTNAGTELATIPATGGGPHRKVFSLNGEMLQESFAAFEPWWRGGYDIAATTGAAYIISGAGRRVSVRKDTPSMVDDGRKSDDHYANLGANPTSKN